MATLARLIGGALICVSVLAVIQTVREIALWEVGGGRYAEQSISERAFTFAGRRIAASDDLPTDTGHSQAAVLGVLSLRIGGAIVGSPTKADIRRALTDKGRYHLWFDA